MSLPVVQTKILKPPVPIGLVTRKSSIWNIGSQRLTLLCAPAGFGKTTLALQLLQQDDKPTAWLSIDKSLDDPNHFGVYLVHAFHQLDGLIDEMLLRQVQSPSPPPLFDVVIRLINRIAGAEVQPMLVLDDLHLITEATIYQALDYLLDNQPYNLQIVVTSREDPPLALSRLRARGQLLEIRAHDLRFSHSETADFLNNVLSLELDAKQIQTLDDRTEGWPAGLQFAGLSLQYEEDKTEFIRAFSASHRYVLDYLSDEVLRQIPPDIYEFLLRTSILTRLSADLCNRVTQRDDAQVFLETIERRNLFLMRLDHQRQWYRYHQLFADLLRRRLYREYPDSISALHLRASQWYAEQGSLSDAIHHAELGNHTQQLVDLLAKHGMSLILQGYVDQVRRWFDKLPEEIIRDHPRVLMSYCWLLFLSNDTSDLPSLVDSVESITEQNDVLGEVAIMRAFLSEEDPDKMQVFALRALDLLPAENLAVRGMAHIALSDVYRVRDEKQLAFDELLKVVDVQLISGNLLAATNSLLNATFRCLPLVEWNRLDTTIDAVFDTFEKTGNLQDPAFGAAHIARGWVMLHRLELPGAIEEIKRGLELANQSGIRAWQLGRIPLIQALIQYGELDQIDRQIEELVQVVNEAPDNIRAFLSRLLTHIFIDLGDFAAAVQWLSQTSDGIEEQLAALRLQVAQGETAPDALLISLDPIVRQIEIAEWNGVLVDALVMKAALNELNLDPTAADEDLTYAIRLAEPNGERYGFYQNIKHIHPVLSRLTGSSFAMDLLSESANTVAGTFSHPSLVEPLTEREVSILKLMTQGLTYDAIGDELMISINTVRYHIKSLYGKLGVSSRADAIASTQKLGLLL